jgi:hypothetical protein
MLSQSSILFIYEIQSLAEEESREYKSFLMMKLKFVFYLYFNIQNMQNIYHVSTITALCYMSILPFQLILHSLTVW